MLYPMECPKCGTIAEYWQGMNDEDVMTPCEACGEEFTRRGHLVYNMVPMSLHTNCANGVSYEYFDPHLVAGGVQVKSKQHRKDLMEQEGLREYAPNPELERKRTEATYVRKHAGPKDAAAANAAVKELHKTAAQMRKEKIADRGFAEVAEKIKAQVLQ